MPSFTGNFRQRLLEKINKTKDPTTEEEPVPMPVIKKTEGSAFVPRASDYYKEIAKQQSVPAAPRSVFNPQSPIHKPVHERMKEFVKSQYKGK